MMAFSSSFDKILEKIEILETTLESKMMAKRDKNSPPPNHLDISHITGRDREKSMQMIQVLEDEQDDSDFDDFINNDTHIIQATTTANGNIIFVFFYLPLTRRGLLF